MISPQKPLVTAMIGVTISCTDPDAMTRMFVDALGWEIATHGKIDTELEACWGIASGSAGTEFALLRSPGADRGMLRVVAGAERIRSRPIAARWAGVEVLVTRDLDQLFEQLDRHTSFATLHRPFDMDWSEFGSNVHRAFLGAGPGSTHLVFTMALTKPEGRSFPAAAARVGHIFDVPLISGEFERSSRFYQQTLGMVPFLESRFDSGLWHELWQIPDGSPVALDILKGDAPGTGLGGIELQGYDAALIDPEPARRDRLDGGACMVTYTSTDLDAAYRAVTNAKDAIALSSPRSTGASGYQGSRGFAFLGPCGERLEICDSIWV